MGYVPLFVALQGPGLLGGEQLGSSPVSELVWAQRPFGPSAVRAAPTESARRRISGETMEGETRVSSHMPLPWGLCGSPQKNVAILSLDSQKDLVEKPRENGSLCIWCRAWGPWAAGGEVRKKSQLQRRGEWGLRGSHGTWRPARTTSNHASLRASYHSGCG